MNGKQIKEKLKKDGFILSEIAESMQETPQNLQSMLRTTDIKTGVLERIATAINKSLYYFFEEENIEETTTVEEPTSEYLSNANKTVSIPSDAWLVIKQQSASLESKDNQIDRVITLLENQISESKKTAVRPEENVICADAVGSGISK